MHRLIVVIEAMIEAANALAGQLWFKRNSTNQAPIGTTNLKPYLTALNIEARSHEKGP